MKKFTGREITALSYVKLSMKKFIDKEITTFSFMKTNYEKNHN